MANQCVTAAPAFDGHPPELIQVVETGLELQLGPLRDFVRFVTKHGDRPGQLRERPRVRWEQGCVTGGHCVTFVMATLILAQSSRTTTPALGPDQ